MTSFYEYLLEAFNNQKRTVNKHSTHIEELIFTQRKQGVEHAIEGLQHIIDTINSNDGKISTKIDGCVHQDTLVVTSKGYKRICELTNDDFICCYDIKEKRYRYCNHTNPRITGKSKRWVKVTLNNHGEVLCTSDHYWLLSNDKWVRAESLAQKNVRAPSSPNKSIRVDDVQFITTKYDQWDLTTQYHNFVIVVNGEKVVIHNSPAIFIVNGENGVGVATKSIFNTNPKINYTVDDIQRNHTGNLADKLKVALQYLPKIIPSVKNRIYQGDMLFTNDKKHFTKGGVDLIGFHPNTIAYTVEANSPLGKQIDRAKIGLAVHTLYDWDGKDPSTIDVLSYGLSKDDFKDSDDVFLIDTVSNINEKHPRFDKDYTQQFNQIRKLANQIDWSILDDDFVVAVIQTFINTHFRNNKQMSSPKQRANDLFDYIQQRIETESSKRKTEKGKQSVKAKYEIFDNVRTSIVSLQHIFEIFDIITSIKIDVIRFLDKISKFHNFVIKSNGDLVGVGEEGYFITQTSAKGAKLVDRYSFATNNFSKDIIRSWAHGDN